MQLKTLFAGGMNKLGGVGSKLSRTAIAECTSENVPPPRGRSAILGTCSSCGSIQSKHGKIAAAARFPC